MQNGIEEIRVLNFTEFDYQLLVPYIGDNYSDFEYILENTNGVMVGNNSQGTPVQPYKITNDTVYYEYNNITLQTLGLNKTFYMNYSNGTITQSNANVSLEVMDWTSVIKYQFQGLSAGMTTLYLDPELSFPGDYRIFSHQNAENDTNSTNDSSNGNTNENPANLNIGMNPLDYILLTFLLPFILKETRKRGKKHLNNKPDN